MTRVRPKHKRLKTEQKVAVFNVKYSENLGDGMIAESIEQGLLGHEGIGEVTTLDLAGRWSYGTQATRGRKSKMQILGMMPGAMRRVVVKQALAGRISNLREDWARAIARADHVVIGGGHLFQDDDLNFPSKIGALLDICCDQQVPVSVYAVGVTDNWSAPAMELFGKLRLCRVSSISVRDAESQRNWAHHFSGADTQNASIALDPVLGLKKAASVRHSKAIGLCITHPQLIAHHAGVLPHDLLDFFADTVERLCGLGHDVVLFTNGAEEDKDACRLVASRAAVARLISEGRVSVDEDFSQPDELIALISRLQGVIAHRLHANIVAFASGIPSVGLGWDPKVESFFELTSRLPHFVPFDHVDSSLVVQRLLAALEEGIDAETRERVRSMARDGLRDLADRIATEGMSSPTREASQKSRRFLGSDYYGPRQARNER